MKLGAAQNQSPSAWRLVEVNVDKQAGVFTYALRRDKLREVRRREGRYLLRTNLVVSQIISPAISQYVSRQMRGALAH